MNKYDFKKIEDKWSRIWQKQSKNGAKDFDKKPKHYNLVEFPYPSGEGLHVGHCMGYGASDAYCRMKRMQGYNVLFPIGWDAFGLPTENYAIKTGIKPRQATAKNIDNFRRQMKMMGYSFDFDHEVNTTDPDYYKWTQWIFLQLYKHGIKNGKVIKLSDDDFKTPRLAYRKKVAVNWCSACKINLANEEVINGKCERCGEETEKKVQTQWMLRITAYADKLIDDLDTVDYLEKIKTQQINWIGRSEGTNIIFNLKSQKSNLKINQHITVFTTRADTLFGCTYLVLSPEHEIISKIKDNISNIKDINNYIGNSKKKTDLERSELQKVKTGVEIKGISAINPINNQEIPIFVADYVLSSYGTGAVMAVPAHDQRDFEFAMKYKISIKQVIIPKVIDKHNPPKNGVKTVFRNAIQAIVINPKNKKVLCLKWKKHPWTTFITGGIDEGEDYIKGAKREILEETGYKNVKLVRKLGDIVESHFYANYKGENRKAHFQGLLFELENEDQDEISTAEKDIHDVVWMTWKELNKDENIKCAEYDIWIDRLKNKDHSFTNYGVLINSGKFSGLESKEAIKMITENLKLKTLGNFTKNYKLRDWVFSRQHYWGEPIPIIYCRNCFENLKLKNKNNDLFSNTTFIDKKECVIVPIDEEELPIALPEVENFKPTDTGESPLSKIKKWVNIKCPRCGSDAVRETDTMPNWAGSSWYYLAYTLNKKLYTKNQINKNIFIKNKKLINYWMPVDLYNGGMEHTTIHLLYSRFWHKFLYDIKMVDNTEPYQRRIAHGVILGTDNQKMSKSKGNVINPDDMVKKFGADTLRMYIMFIGPYDKESTWNMDGAIGVSRFINRLWNNFSKVKDIQADKKTVIEIDKTIREVSFDIENYQLNTYIARLMEFNNHLTKLKEIPLEIFKKYIILLSPAAPYIAEELWRKIGHNYSVFINVWPKYNQKLIEGEKIVIAVQINGKVRDRISVENDIKDDDIRERVLNLSNIKKYIKNNQPKKIIIVKNKIVSIVI